MPAAATIGFRFEPRGGKGPRRLLLLGAAAVFGLLSQLLGALETLPTADLVLYRLESGVIIAQGPVKPELKRWFNDRLQDDLKGLDEADFLAKWDEPKRWLPIFGSLRALS